MAHQRRCFRIILHLFISQPSKKDYGAPLGFIKFKIFYKLAY